MSENKEEDKYFKQRELERREAARRERELAALRQTEREGIAEVLNTTEEIAEEALELGFSQETARVLPLIPLIQVAWVDGSVSTAEERAILDLAVARGLEKGTPSFDFLTRLLAERPADLFFERTNRVIAELVQADPDSWVKKTVPELCKEVADASGGFFGLGNRISKEEQDLIDEIAELLDASSATVKDLGVFKGDE
ncbi:MAG: hypothetical protein VYE40_17675 [Myxococcota bacterium]|jgi:hypothetical protein|nr:hypothetical protein [Myxococcota bacterium]MEC9442927.1 hypothetical protein [Myxococcota bacterium]